MLSTGPSIPRSSPAARLFLEAVSVPVERRPAAPVTLLLAAHPDDEVLGVGGQLAWLAPAVHVAHLTPGIPIALDANQHGLYGTPEVYGACRARELDAALSRARVPPARRHLLRGADQRSRACWCS